MASFDYKQARADGISDEQIQQYIREKTGKTFDFNLARQDGLSDNDIQNLLKDIPLQKEQKGLVESVVTDIGDNLMKTGSGLVGGIGQIATTGYVPNTIRNTYATVSGLLSGNLVVQPDGRITDAKGNATQQYGGDEYNQQALQFAKNTENAVEGAGALASYVAPAGTGIAARGTLGGLQGAAVAANQDGATAQDIALGAGIGAGVNIVAPPVLNAAGKMVASGAGKAKNVIADLILNQADDKALASMNLTRGSLNKFEKKTGQEMVDFLRQEKLVGAKPEDVVSRIDDMMTKYDDAIATSNKRISGDKLFDRFEARINAYESGYTAQDKSIAKKLTDVYDSIVAKHGTGEVDSKTLVEVKRGIQKAVNDRQFMLPADEANANKQAFDIIKDLLDESTDGQTKVLGNKLRKLLPLKDILVERSRNAPGYSLGQGVQDLSTFVGGNAFGGPVGGIGLLVLKRLEGTPTAQLIESQLMSKIGVGIKDLSKPEVLQRVSPYLDDIVTNIIRNQVVENPPELPAQEQSSVNTSKMRPMAGANVGDALDPIRRQKQALLEKQRSRPKTLA